MSEQGHSASACADNQPVADAGVVSGHTPGPWFADVDYRHGPVVTNGDGVHVADYTVWPHSLWGEAKANARLIAAAPDLLEAARLAEDIIDDFLGHLSPDEQVACAEDPKAAAALKALRAAIAKATTANSVGTPEGVNQTTSPDKLGGGQ